MSTSPESQQKSKSNRKPNRIIDSGEESDYEAPPRSDPVSPAQKQPTKTPIKRKAITRRPSKRKSEALDETTAPEPPAVTNADTPATEKGKEKAIKGEPPLKRQKLPSMKRKPSEIATPAEGGTPNDRQVKPVVVKPAAPVSLPSRPLVDGPPPADVDLRDADVFSQLFKKTGTGNSNMRYDLTTREKTELKKAELSHLREEYIAKKKQEKVSPFDLQAQNRKINQVQRMLWHRHSRVCPNVMASCIDSVHRDWIRPPGKSTPPT